MKIKNEIGNRIQLLIEKENISSQNFANEIGITLGGLNHILTGRNKPRFDIIQKIIHKYKSLNLDWLVSGELPMYKLEKNIFQTDLCNNKEKLNTIQMKELPSLSENIEEIRIYLKNKTYLVFKLEK